MSNAGWFRAAGTAATLACLALLTPAATFGAVGTGRSTASASTPSPPPKVEGKKTKWGVSLSSQRRLQISREKRNTNPRRVTDRDPSRPRAGRTVTNVRSISRRPFRLNIGICGRVGPDGTFPGPTRCQPFSPDRPDRPTPPGGVVRRVPRPADVTWEQILAEYKDVLFPGLGVKVQPSGRTLVNLDTVVYTDESKVSTNSVSLLGFPVVVEATPMSYTWNFGDGKTLTTSTPGKAYPSKEITHKYLKRGNVSVTLTTNYAARYNVADTGWQYVDGTVPITGPATALIVREAVPVLVDPQR